MKDVHKTFASYLILTDTFTRTLFNISHEAGKLSLPSARQRNSWHVSVKSFRCRPNFASLPSGPEQLRVSF
jgi:hypothetical protein